MKQPDLYYFETIKMTSEAWSNFVWRIRAAGEYSLWTLTRLVTSLLWFRNSIDQVVSLNKSFILYRTTTKNYVVCRNPAKVVKLKIQYKILQLLNVQKSQNNVTPIWHKTRVARQKSSLNWSFIMSRDNVCMFAT